MIILFFVLGGAYYLNEKLDKMNDMWMSSNQVTIKNQKEQIKINRAFGNQRDDLRAYINNLPSEQRSKWLDGYDEKIQKLLYTPPKGLRDQSEGL